MTTTTSTEPRPCPHCDELYFVELLEYYPEERTFTIETCCEASHYDTQDELAWFAENDPRELGRWLSQQLEGYGIAKVRQVVSDDEAAGTYGNGGICVDFGLRLETIGRTQAQAWIKAHHRHNEAPSCSRFNLAIYNGTELVAVMMVGNPVARLTMQNHPDWLEVNRVCVAADLPSWVVWNACSMLYGAAVREAKARGFKRVITYTREDETGGTLVAAGWTQTHRTKLDKRNWERKGRAAKRAPRCPAINKSCPLGTDEHKNRHQPPHGHA